MSGRPAPRASAWCTIWRASRPVLRRDPHVEPAKHPTGGDGDDSPSTGFLPISLAVALLLCGLLVVPGLVRCDPSRDASVDTP
jgi:hypothetical protein